MPGPRTLTTTLLAVTLAFCLQGVSTAGAAARPRSRVSPTLSLVHPVFSAERADIAMHRDFDAPHDLLTEVAEPGSRAQYAFAWSTSQALAADIAVAKVTKSPVAVARVRRDLTGLSHYWNGAGSPPGYDSYVVSPLGNGGARFYDDNAWIGLDLVRAYQLLGEPALLQRAEEVFAFTKSGWDANPSDAYPGGVFWTESRANRDRNTVSTSGAANLGLQLYLINRKQADLETASSMLAWVNATLRGPNGLYWDHISLNGRIAKRQWSYNQGMMLGAYLLLNRATGETTALQQAEAIATASLGAFRAGEYRSQPAIFNAIYFRNLAELNLTAPHKAYVNAMRTFVASVDSHVSRRTGIIRFERLVHLLGQAAATTANADLAMVEQ